MGRLYFKGIEEKFSEWYNFLRHEVGMINQVFDSVIQEAKKQGFSEEEIADAIDTVRNKAHILLQRTISILEDMENDFDYSDVFY